MSDLEAAIAAEMKRQGCEAIAYSASSVPVCLVHDAEEVGLWDEDRDACMVVAESVRAGYDAAIEVAAEVERLREQVETLQAEARRCAADELTRIRYRDEMATIYGIEAWIDTGDSMSGWGHAEAVTTVKHDALQTMQHWRAAHPGAEFRLVEAQRTPWLPVAEEGPTP